MDRYAILVDAGYFFAAGAFAITGKQKTKRREISVISPADLLESLATKANKQTGIPNQLRVYWYDALSGPRPSIDQSALAHQPALKLRLGTLNNAGEQKGVDSLIVTDLIELARNRAITDAVIVSGDEDLRIAFQIAQSYGVRVHLLAIGDPTSNVSPTLRMEADSLEAFDVEWLKSMLRIAAPTEEISPESVPTTTTTTVMLGSNTTASLDDAARAVAVELMATTNLAEREQLQRHLAENPTVPPEFDRRLIAITASRLGRMMTGVENRRIRGIFINYVKSLNQ